MRRPVLHSVLHPITSVKRPREHNDEEAGKRARVVADEEDEWDSDIPETDTDSDYTVYSDNDSDEDR
tara:strand:+ start:169 stop:369 length:201 start_codon:yes stop_codon:yes gene_type:complete